MAHYVDGFVFPVPRNRLGDYKQVAAAAAAIWREYGALDYHEYLGDDLVREGTRSFVDVVGARPDEAVVFGWVVFESREARDQANEKVAADPRMVDLMASYDTGFDGNRMAYGGFEFLV